LGEIKKLGYGEVRVEGDSEIADVCRLTCLEQGIEIVSEGSIPILEVQGYTVILNLDQAL